MQVRWASGLNVLAGIWLIIAPWVLGFSNAQGALWNSIIVGVIVGVLAGIRFFGALQEAWLSWLNVAAGVWLFISAFFLNANGDALAMWDAIILGIIVTALAWWSAMESPVGPSAV